MSILGFYYRAVVSPVRRVRPANVLRALLRLPVVFDLATVILQTRQLGRLSTVHDKTVADDPYHQKVQNYNAGVTATKRITTTRRAEEYYEILALPPRDMSDEKLLVVGPRNVHELFLAWLYGFSWKNIQAIDLYSTHPKIVPMNMEAMTFADGSFDAVSMANTLSYAKDTGTAIKEVARVLKPGGRFAFSGTYDPGQPDWYEDKVSGAKIHQLLHENGMSVYHHTSIDKVNSKGRVQCSHSFGALKRTDKTSIDPLAL